MESGVSGFIKGVGVGVAGVIVKPVRSDRFCNVCASTPTKQLHVDRWSVLSIWLHERRKVCWR
jgi:hypothetical protein